MLVIRGRGTIQNMKLRLDSLVVEYLVYCISETMANMPVPFIYTPAICGALPSQYLLCLLPT
jgi:hypothetical protein